MHNTFSFCCECLAIVSSQFQVNSGLNSLISRMFL
jgi:hypothetical protein